jgi:hypothetical protein
LRDAESGFFSPLHEFDVMEKNQQNCHLIRKNEKNAHKLFSVGIMTLFEPAEKRSFQIIQCGL